MKILMVLSNPYMVDPRVRKEAVSLTENGHDVTVIFWDRPADYPIDDQVEHVRVIGIRNKGVMKMLPHDVFRNPFWWHKAYKKAVTLYKSGYRFDVIHCHDLDTLVVGFLLKNKFNIQLVYDAHEIFGYMVARTMPTCIVKMSFFLEKYLIRYVNKVITAEETYIQYFRSITDKDVITILNCNDLVTNVYKAPNNSIFQIIYIGVLNKSRFFPECLEIIGSINNVKFLIAGKKENMFNEVKELSKNYENITFLGSIPYNEVIPYTIKANVVLCMINPEDIKNKISTANKQYEAMVCGRPIICTKGTRSGDITKQENCGLIIEYTKKALEEAVKKLRDSPDICELLGHNALKAAINKYNWENEKEKLLKLYNNNLN